MITTETLLPIWTTFFASIGVFFGVRKILKRRKEQKNNGQQIDH